LLCVFGIDRTDQVEFSKQHKREHGLQILDTLNPQDLLGDVERMWSLSAVKIRHLEQTWRLPDSAPVFTKAGSYHAREWTHWTQGFRFGSALLQFEATQDEEFLDIGRNGTNAHIPWQVTHHGVHDHGFNVVSTYGNLWRIMNEGLIVNHPAERETVELALRCSGSVQAHRWSHTRDLSGYIYSFNGPHSLFCDTMRSLRSLALAHRLGQVLLSENDERVSLLQRLIQHAMTTIKYNVYFGEGRDRYDVAGRVAHESIFNSATGVYRCPSTQQGYSPFSTWTRGLAWVMLGIAEQLEFLETVDSSELIAAGFDQDTRGLFVRAAYATAEFYLANTTLDGIPYWDTGAPGLSRDLGWRERLALPTNSVEPLDSSAAAIAAQALIRFGVWLSRHHEDLPQAEQLARRYVHAGLTVARTLFREPFLSTSESHQGLLLHAVYHWPRGWDYVPPGSTIPYGESCMWGDYHLRELAIQIHRMAMGLPEHTYFGQSNR
jgi:unsaturated chondroitin disaccharide hydrolase